MDVNPMCFASLGSVATAARPMPPSGPAALYPGAAVVSRVCSASKTGHFNTAFVLLFMRAKLVELYAHVLNIGLQKTWFASALHFFSPKKAKTHDWLWNWALKLYHLCMSRLRQQLLMQWLWVKLGYLNYWMVFTLGHTHMIFHFNQKKHTQKKQTNKQTNKQIRVFSSTGTSNCFWTRHSFNFCCRISNIEHWYDRTSGTSHGGSPPLLSDENQSLSFEERGYMSSKNTQKHTGSQLTTLLSLSKHLFQ